MRFLRSSSPSQLYSSLTSTLFQVQARQVPEGMEKAFVPLSMRIPLGPSEQQPRGMPKPSSLSVTPPKAAAVPDVTLGEHMPSPLVRQIRSSSVSCARKSSMDTLPSPTSQSRQPLSPV